MYSPVDTEERLGDAVAVEPLPLPRLTYQGVAPAEHIQLKLRSSSSILVAAFQCAPKAINRLTVIIKRRDFLLAVHGVCCIVNGVGAHHNRLVGPPVRILDIVK